jgi:fatty acid-binding protein DegV
MVGSVDCLAEKFACLDSLVASREEGAEVRQGARLFQAGIRTSQHLDRLTQQDLAPFTAG